MKRGRNSFIIDSDKRGYIVLLALILLVGALAYFLRSVLQHHNEPTSYSNELQEQMSAFQAEQESYAQLHKHARFQHEERTIETFAFNPNTCDSLTFLRLGLKPWQAHNALKYRAHGGKWRTADDFRRLYGLSEADFLRLKPFIKISSETATQSNNETSDSLVRKYTQKYPEGMQIDLNRADTSSLKGIPGIGSYYAQKICRYKENLGGFINVNQIDDIEGVPEQAKKFLYVQPDVQVRKIDVNKASFKQLVRHPYLNYEQTCEIANYIRKHGKLNDWQDLQFSEHFTEADFKRLSPYFYFK